MDVTVVLVGLNACRFIDECIDSIGAARWEGLGYEVVYVDNGSSDGTLEMMHTRHPEVSVVANARNVGFCPAANQGARQARGRYLLFLNDDTLVVEDAVPKLVALLEARPDVGVVGSRLLNLDGTDQWSGRRFPTLLNGLFGRRTTLSRWFPRARVLRDYLCEEEVRRGDPFEVDWVSAAALMVSRDLFREVGGFAEDYYYWHEAVFCDRIRRRQLSVFLHPQSKIIHYEGKGSGARPYAVRKWHIRNFHAGAFRCYCEHHGLRGWSPRRWLAGAALASRAAALLALHRVRKGDSP